MEAGAGIAIVGAGPVGATLALALSRAGVPAVLVERRGRPSPEHRPIALSCASWRILDALGVWSRVAPHAAPIVRVHVSQRGCFGATRFCAAELGVEALGYVSDARTLAGAFDDALAESAGVRLFASTDVEGIARSRRGLRLALAGAAADAGTRSLEVQAVVAADGGQTAWCAADLGAVEVREYAQAALGAELRGERDHQGVAYERFTPEGPIALLPMQGRHCALVWTLAPKRGKALRCASETTFLDELHRSFGDRLGRFVGVRRRELFPLRRVRARTARDSRIFLIGSAANTLHPVAGQGLNLGLRDAAALAEVFVEAERAGEDPGAPRCFERYRARRRSDHARIGRATDLLARVFLPRTRCLAALRGAALVGLDLAAPVKRGFARHAMGLGVPQSRLVRGLSL